MIKVGKKACTKNLKVGKKTCVKNFKVGKEVQEAEGKNKMAEENVERRVIFPRIRLSPRLSISSRVENKKRKEQTETNLVENKREEKTETNLVEKKREEKTETNLEKNKRLVVSLNASEIEEYYSKEMPHLNSSPGGNTNKERGATSISSLENMENNVHDEDIQNFLKSKKQRVSQCKYWTDKEMTDLAYALEHCGFNDMKKVADEVKTKTEKDISLFVKKCVNEVRKEKNPDHDPDKRGRPHNPWLTVSKKNLESWPTVRKWKRVAYEEMMPYTRAKDYSRPVITALCNKFYEEEPEPDNPQVINVKLIYKYIADCMAGAIPPQLPPKESALVLDLLREVRMMSIVYDFEEERKFLKDFKKTTTFKPIEVKDEFKKKLNPENEELDDTDAVPVPEQIFADLSRHRRLMQSFNPLVTPVWMLQKEQEHLEKNLEESNVYVDEN